MYFIQSPLTPEDDEVNTQVPICPVVMVLEVNVALLVPTLLPFTFH